MKQINFSTYLRQIAKRSLGDIGRFQFVSFLLINASILSSRASKVFLDILK